MPFGRSSYTDILPEFRTVSAREVDQIIALVNKWPDVIREVDDLEVPHSVDKPFPELRLHRDGWLCRLQPTQCHHISGSEGSMRKHFTNTHRTSIFGEKGRPTRRRKEQKVNEEGIHPGYDRVVCQRFFPSRYKSQYFQVRQPDTVAIKSTERLVPVWQQARELLSQTRSTIEEAGRIVVQEGNARDVNAWLERTGWDRYLVDMEVNRLLECVEEPDEESERELWMIWRGVEEMAQGCQSTVVSKVGLWVRFEAIRTEKHQTRYVPLQAYMDRRAVREHARPWKEILMFIGRTLGRQEWKKPRYKLTKEQKKIWKQLWTVAGEEYVQLRGEEGSKGQDDSKSGDADDGKHRGHLARLPYTCLNF